MTNKDKLMKMAGAVRTGGKGSVRRDKIIKMAGGKASVRSHRKKKAVMEVEASITARIFEGLKIHGTVEDLETAPQKSAEEVIDEIGEDNSSSLFKKWEQKMAAAPPAWELKYYFEIIEDISDRLTLEQEQMPYTNLADLSDKAAVAGGEPIQFKIQGHVLGISRFLFVGMAEYELVVSLQDRSHIAEVLIHHDIVQRQIGLSPKEVDEIFSSSAGHAMADIIKEYGRILCSLSATLIIEMKVSDSDSGIPVAIEVDSTWDFG